MGMIELTKYFKRDRNAEKEILDKFSDVLKKHFTREEIEQTLLENGFNGVYLLDEKQIETLNELLDEDEKNQLLDELSKLYGQYHTEQKVIIMHKDAYMSNKTIGIHEMGHAFLDSKNEAIIEVNGTKIRYGIGLEEGAVTSLMVTDDIANITNYAPDVYPEQTILFQQLNVLYGYSRLKKYPNLLIHMFKEPENFMVLIREIYTDIYEQNYETMDIPVITKSAFDIIVGADTLINDNEQNEKLMKTMQGINSVYLYMADEKIRCGKRKNALFLPFRELQKTSEEILLETIFGDESSYMERISNLLEDLVIGFQDTIEKRKTKTYTL